MINRLTATVWPTMTKAIIDMIVQVCARAGMKQRVHACVYVFACVCMRRVCQLACVSVDIARCNEYSHSVLFPSLPPRTPPHFPNQS